MKLSRFARPSPALVVSVIALVVALGGTSYAAFSIPKNSVGSKQLKKNAVTNIKLSNGSISGAKIRNGAVSGAKIAKGAISGANLNLATLGTVPSAANSNFATNAGHASTADSATKATTADNATNATNANTANTATALGSVSYVSGPTITAPKCSTTPCTNPSDTSGTATCPAGLTATAGGVETSAGGEEINESIPQTALGSSVPNEWHAFVDNFTAADHNFNVIVICTKVAAVDNQSGLKTKASSSR